MCHPDILLFTGEDAGASANTPVFNDYMKTFQEIIRSLDTEKLINAYLQVEYAQYVMLRDWSEASFKTESRLPSREEVGRFITRLRTIEPEPIKDGDVGIFLAFHFYNSYFEEIASELGFRSEILEKGTDAGGYGLMLVPHAEVVGCYVADTKFVRDHLYQVIADIMHEAAWLGFDQAKLSEMLDGLVEAIAKKRTEMETQPREAIEPVEESKIKNYPPDDETTPETERTWEAISEAIGAHRDASRAAQLREIRANLA